MATSDEDDAWLDIINFHYSQRDPAKYVDPTSGKTDFTDARKQLQEANKLIRTQYFYERHLECPLCGFRCSSNNQNSAIGVRFLAHIMTHQSSFDPSVYKACSYCFGPIIDARLGDGCEQCSKDVAGNKSEKDLLSIVDYSCSVNRYIQVVQHAKTISRTKAPRVISLLEFPRESLFRPVVMKGSFASFVDYQKSICSEVGIYVATFHFIFRSHLFTMRWSCLLCADKPEVVICRNDISFRLYVLLHLQQFHPDVPQLMKMVRDEWTIINKELCCSVEKILTYSMTPLKIHRTAAVYFSQANDENKYIINEMSRRVAKTVIAGELCFCKICFEPQVYRVDYLHKHIQWFHRGILTHAGMSDFYSVVEIASCSNMTPANFPTVLLRYSEQFRSIVDKSIVFYKWKCLLPCCKPGHINDVLEFPSVLLLRMYALRHLENFHNNVFSDAFMEREWAVVNMESGLNDVDLRNYDQSSYENVCGGSDDPNDFVFPYLMYILPVDIRNFLKICGVCYWAGLHNQFLDHIVIHDYRNSNKYLSSNSSLKEVLDTYGIKKTTKVKTKKLPDASSDILGLVGKNWLNLMRKGSFSLDAIEYSSGGYETLDHNIHGEEWRSSRKSAVTAKERLKNGTRKFHFSDESSCSGSDSNSDNYAPSESDEGDLLANVEDFAIPNRDEPRSSTYLAQSTTVSSAVDHDTEDTTTSNKDNLKENVLDLRIIQRVTQNMSELYASSTLLLDDLDASELAAIQLIVDRRCPICPQTPKVRVGRNLTTPADNSTVEEAVFGHMILKHSTDKLAQKLVQIKCFQFLRSQVKFPTAFLLKTDESGLLYCSLCSNRSFNKLSAVKAHFTTCSKHHCRLTQEICPSKSRKVTENATNSCPLESCNIEWKGSTHYPPGVSQIVHIINQHVHCAAACEKALEISIVTDCKKNAPYIDTEQSIRESKSLDHAVVVCSRCSSQFKTLLELSAHSRKYHEKEASQKCSFGCPEIHMTTSFSDYVGDADMVFFHHVFSHPEENLNKWFETWPLKKELSKAKFNWDVKRSIDYVSKHNKAGLICSNDDCDEDFIANLSDIRFHLHVSSPISKPSASAKRLVAACMNRKAEIKQPEKQEIVKRKARMDYAQNKICRLCNRSIPKNSLYSCDQMTTFIHTVTCHPLKISDVEWEQRAISLSFPYLDVDSTVVRSGENGSSVFVCSICNFESSTSKQVLGHVMCHEGVVTLSSERSLECKKCSEVICLNGVFASEQFSILAHAVDNHSTDHDFLENSFAAVKDRILTDDEDLLNLLDYEASSRKCRESGKACMVCLECRQNFSNSLAFLHHSKQHIPRFADKIHHIMHCFNRSRQLNYAHNIKKMFYCHLCERRISLPGVSATFSLDYSMMAHLILYHRDDVLVKCYVDRNHEKLAAMFPFLDSKKSYGTKKLYCIKCPQTSFGRENEQLKHAKQKHDTLPTTTTPQRRTSRLSSCGSEDIFDGSGDEPSKNSLAPLTYSPENQLNGEISFDRGDLELTQEQLPGSLIGARRINTSANDVVASSLELAPLRLDTVLNRISENANIERLDDSSVSTIDNEQSSTKEITTYSSMLGCFTPEQRIAPRRSIILSTASSPKSGPIRRHKVKSRTVTQTPKTTRKVIRIGFDEADEPKNSAVLVPEKGQTRIDRFLQKRSPLVIPDAATPIITDGEVSAIFPESPAWIDINRATENTCDPPSATHSQDLVANWLNTKCLSESRITPRRIAEPLFLQDNTGSGLPVATNLKTLLDSITTPDIQHDVQSSSCSVGALLPSSRLKGLNLVKKEPVDISHLDKVAGYRCSAKDCMFVGLSATDTRTHMTIRHGQTSVSAAKLITRDAISPCIICKQVFVNRVKLLTHIADFHKNEKYPYPCSYCSQLFATVSRVREHERRIHEWSMKSNEDSSQYCSVCNERFSTARNAREHEKRMHSRKRPAND